ncbi:MAG: hypothetical protein ICV74_04545 [Thermoleophilia bacterium]|nr:hypothetical protein [Thermoleophilia bacterium]
MERRAADLAHVALDDALSLTLLLPEADPARYDARPSAGWRASRDRVPRTGRLAPPARSSAGPR